MSFTLILVMSFAAYRICRLIISDTLFDRPREAFKRRYPPNKEYARWYSSDIVLGNRPSKVWNLAETPRRKPNKLSEGLFCFWCLGVWIAAIETAVVANLTSVKLPVLVWLTVSAGVGLISRNLDHA